MPPPVLKNSTSPAPTTSAGSTASASAVTTTFDQDPWGAPATPTAETPAPAVGNDFETEFKDYDTAHDDERAALGGDDGYDSATSREAAKKYVIARAQDTGDEAVAENPVATASMVESGLTVAELSARKRAGVTEFQEQESPVWSVEAMSGTDPQTRQSYTVYQIVDAKKVVSDVLEAAPVTGQLQFKDKKSETDLQNSDVIGFMRGTIPKFDQMSEEQQGEIYQYVTSQAPDKLDQMQAVADLASGKKKFDGFSLVERSIGEGYGARTYQEDRSDVEYLEEHLDRSDIGVYQEALKYYEENVRTFRLADDPDERWNFVHNFISESSNPQDILDLDVGAADTAEGEEGKKPDRRKSDAKRSKDADKYWDGSGLIEFARGAAALMDTALKLKAESEDPRVAELLAHRESLPLLEEAHGNAKAKATAAEKYSAHYRENVAPLEKKRADADAAVATSLDMSADEVASADRNVAEAVDVTDAAKAELAGLTFAGDGADAQQDAMRRYLAKADDIRQDGKIENAEITELAAIAGEIWGDDHGRHDSFVATMQKEADAKTRQESIDAEYAKYFADNGDTTGFTSKAELDTAIADAQEKLTAERGPLTDEAIETLTGNDQEAIDKSIAELQSDERLRADEITIANDRINELDAQTGYSDKEADFEKTKQAYSDLVAAKERGDVRAANDALETLTGVKGTLARNNLTEPGLAKKRTVKKENQEEAARVGNHFVTMAELPGKFVQAGASILDGVQKGVDSFGKLLGLDKQREGVERARKHREAGLTAIITNGVGRRKDLTIKALREQFEAPKEQTANQKAATDRAYGEKSGAKARKEDRVSRMGVFNGSEEAERNKILAETNKLNIETKKKSDAEWITV